MNSKTMSRLIKSYYGYTDGCLIRYGANTDEMLDCLVGGCTDKLLWL